MVGGFVAVFAHPRLATDVYNDAVSTYFDAGIAVPQVLFVDPSGREIPDTRLGPGDAPVKSKYLKNARLALETFRGGRSAAAVREAWIGFARARALVAGGEDPAAGIATLQAMVQEARKGDPVGEAAGRELARIQKEEAGALLEAARGDLDTGFADMALEALITIVRDYDGLSAAKEAARLLERLRAREDLAETLKEVDREDRGARALRDARRLVRAGDKDAARKALEALLAGDLADTIGGLEAADVLETLDE